MSGRGIERRRWAGRPALRLLLLSPAFLAPAAFAGWLADRALAPGRLPTLDAVLPLGRDTLLVLNGACLELAGAVVIGLTLAYLVLSRLVTRYELTNQRLRLARGILVREVDEIELYRIRDVRLRRGPLQRLSGLGTVTVDSTDGTGLVRLGPVSGSARLREDIREASEAQKAQMGMRLVA